MIELDIPAPADSAGGLIVADLNGDGLPDYLVTVPDHVAAYANGGEKLWSLQTPVRVGGSSGARGFRAITDPACRSPTWMATEPARCCS